MILAVNFNGKEADSTGREQARLEGRNLVLTELV